MSDREPKVVFERECPSIDGGVSERLLDDATAEFKMPDGGAWFRMHPGSALRVFAAYIASQTAALKAARIEALEEFREILANTRSGDEDAALFDMISNERAAIERIDGEQGAEGREG